VNYYNAHIQRVKTTLTDSVAKGTRTAVDIYKPAINRSTGMSFVVACTRQTQNENLWVSEPFGIFKPIRKRCCAVIDLCSAAWAISVLEITGRLSQQDTSH
jgi:mRNA-degrading endonuclease toxin of MazEF toxin-antitoxin module